MVHYSLLIPERDAASTVERMLPQLDAALSALVLPYEIICIDDGSSGTIDSLSELQTRYPALRVLRFAEPRGTSAALTAGLNAARGDLVIAVQPNTPHAARWLPHLIARLSQCELVVARRERPIAEEAFERAGRTAAALVPGATVSPREDLFWAATQSAVAELNLNRGAFRLLEAIVARRGMRVCQLTLADDLPPRGKNYVLNRVDRAAAWWLDRRFEPHLASELVRVAGQKPKLVPARFDAARPRHVPQPLALPVERERPDSA